MKKLLIALSLFAMVLAPAAGVMAQEVAESGTNTETFENVNSTGGDVTLTTDDANNYDALYNFEVYNATSATQLTDGTEYIMDGQDVVILADQITTDSTIEVTYGYDIYAESDSAFSGLSGSIDLSLIGGYIVNLFTQMWEIIALAIAIPLAFVIGKRLKGLFN